MNTVSTVFSALLPIFVIVAAGFVCRRVNWLSEEADRSLMRVVVNLLYPCLIFSFVVGNDALRNPLSILFPPLIGFTMVIAGFGIALFVARTFGLGAPRQQRTFAFSVGIFNYGYFAIPLSLLLFGREVTGILLVFNIGVEVALWAVGVGFILGGEAKSRWKKLFSPPVCALLVAIPINILRLDQWLPDFVFEAIDLLAACAIPLGVLLIGATLADLTRGFTLRNQLAIPAWGSALRLAILPAIFIFAAWVIPFSPELRGVILVQAAMPCGILPIVLARHYGGDPDTAVKVILPSIVLSLATIPFWIAVGLPLLKLN